MQRKTRQKDDEVNIYFLNCDTAKYRYTIKLTFDAIINILMLADKNLFQKLYFDYTLPHLNLRFYCDISDFHTKYFLELVECICKKMLDLDNSISIAVTTRKTDDKYFTSRFITPDEK